MIILRHLIFITLSLFLLGCRSTGENLELKYQGFKEHVYSTHYIAKVIHTETIKISYNQGESEYSIRLNVIETLKGEPSDEITFTMVTEGLEEPGISNTPVIIALCKDKNGFYWPGTGSILESNKQTDKMIKKWLSEAKDMQTLNHDITTCDY